MKKHLQLMMLTLLCLIMGATGAKAENETESYTFTSKKWEAKDGKGVAANWTAGKDGAGFSNGGIQVTTGVTGANGTSPKSFTNITKVTVTYCTNANNGVGKIAVKVGNGTAKQLGVTTTGGKTARTLDFNFSPAETGAVNIAVKCTTNSIYVIGAEITYSDPNYVAPVTFSPEEGTRLTVGDKITLTSEGNTIYYTTDGSAAADATLNGESPLEVTITDAMAANKQLTVNARAYNSTKNNYSDATSVSYSVVPAGTVFMESFSNTDGSGGNDGKYTGSIGTSGVETDERWADGTFGNCGGADNCLKFGTSNKNGTFTTGTIALNGKGTLTFRAAGWGSGSNTLKVTATGGTITGDTDITLTNGVWKDYTVNITGAEGELVLSFSGKRGFIDDIMVVKEHDCVSTELEVEEITTDGVAKLTGKWDADKFKALDAETGANAYDFTDVSDLPTTFNNQNMAKNPNTMFISPVPGTFLFNELVKKDQGGYQGYNIQIIDHFNNTEDHSVNTAVAPITVVSPFFQRVFSAANVWATAVFPWIQDNMPGNIQIYGLSDVKTENGVTTLTFEEVVAEAPEAGKPYLVHADGADITMAGGGDQTITWETTPVEMDGVTFTPTFVKMAQADNQYALSGTPQGGTPSFGKNTEFDVPAFRSVITKDGNEAKLAVMFNDATGIHKATAEQLSAVFNIYSIDGKIVKRNASSMFSLAPGAYIVNGKKVIVK